MNKDDSLKCISYLSDVIGLLSAKWEKPHSGFEVAILRQLRNIQETIREAYEAEQTQNDGQRVKRVHENLKQLTFTQTDDAHHPLHVRIQTPDRIDIGLWLDRWQTVDTVAWLQCLISHDRMEP